MEPPPRVRCRLDPHHLLRGDALRCRHPSGRGRDASRDAEDLDEPVGELGPALRVQRQSGVDQVFPRHGSNLIPSQAGPPGPLGGKRPRRESALRGIQIHSGLRQYGWMVDACRFLARFLPEHAGILWFQEVLDPSLTRSRGL